MTDWKSYKGQGPWSFAAQPNKWGYLNNPNWVDPPTGPVNYDGNESNEPQLWTPEGNKVIDRSLAGTVHDPCGHWHKKGSIYIPTDYDVNLFRVTDPWLNYGSIQSIYFNTTTKKLSLVDYYISTPGVCGLEMIDNTYLATVEGTEDYSYLVFLDRYLNVVNKYDILNYYDAISPRSYLLKHYGDHIYFLSSGYGITKITYPGLTRVSRFTPGTVFIGSDGNKYNWVYVYGGFFSDPDYYPITGLYWTTGSVLIPDGEHAGLLESWPGTGTAYPGSSINSFDITDNILYTQSKHTPYERLYAHNLSNNERTAAAIPSGYASSVYCSSDGHIYTAGGALWTNYISKYTKNLTLVGHTTTTDQGRSMGSYCISDIGNYIVVATQKYVDDCGLFLIDSGLSIVSFTSTRDTSDVECECIAVYGDYVFVAGAFHIAVYELVDDSFVFLDKILVDFTPEADVGYTTKQLKYMIIPK